MPIWRIDSASVSSAIRDVARKVDQEGNRDRRVSAVEIDQFIEAHQGESGADAEWDRDTAGVLRTHLADRSNLPLWLDVGFVVARRPLTAVSNWLSRVVMGD